jgi:hypothetical protein
MISPAFRITQEIFIYIRLSTKTYFSKTILEPILSQHINKVRK